MAAAAVVSVSMGVMKPVLAKLTTLMGDEYKKQKGLRKELTFLKRELSDMDALLENMDSADKLDPQAKNWRKDIIEMSYNIEDCIDDFMQCVGEADDRMGFLQKAFQYLRIFKDRRRIANRFQEIKTQVMEASERRKRYMLDQCISTTTPVAIDPRLLALYKESTRLVGIDAQKNKLVNWAIDKGQQLIKMMAIVGIGGLGKTTLANEVYHEVEGKFDCKAFVSVSQKPEMIRLFNSLLSQLGLDTYTHACQERDPIDHLRRHLWDKRYFIVVDDLWDERAWGTIQCAFPPNIQGSRVIITTRNVNVARSCCGSDEHIHNMKHLSDQDSKKLFFDRIFGSEDACPSELRKASCEILKKCGGLPLAIITMASMLACQPKRLEGRWEYIQNSLSNKFATNSNYDGMMYILDLSYRDLPRHLKACFLYLGSYPEDHEIDRVELVRRWVAEGFVSSNSTGQDVWNVSESYFNELINRSMIQPTYDGYIGVSSCRVHDMMLELIARKCEEDNFLSLVNDPEAVAELQDNAIRRLTVVGLRGREDGKVATTNAENLSQIRSLTILLEESNWMPPLMGFRFMRVVVFLKVNYGSYMIIDLTCINKLPHLRYLKVGGNVSIVLPCQIRGLRFLETLDLSEIWYHMITELEIVDAPSLSHLIVGTPSLFASVVRKGMILPDWIGTVRSLRTLCGFRVPMYSSEPILGLGELSALSELILHILQAGMALASATWMADLSSSLEKLGNLKQLAVSSFGSGAGVALRDALSSLSPPFFNLERLDLQYGCTFSKVPRWIGHLRNLCDLRLGVKQVLQEDVAIIGTSHMDVQATCCRWVEWQAFQAAGQGGGRSGTLSWLQASSSTKHSWGACLLARKEEGPGGPRRRDGLLYWVPSTAEVDVEFVRCCSW